MEPLINPPAPLAIRGWRARLPPYYPSLLILAAIALGMVLGHWWPRQAQQLRPLGQWFVEAIRLLAGPVIFCTVAAGMATLRGVRQMGRLGLHMLLVFEACTLLALSTGLAAAWLLQPGAGVQAAALPGPGSGTATLASVSGIPRDAALAITAVPLSAPPLLHMLRASLAHNSAMQLLLAGLVAGIVLAWSGPRGARVGGWLERVGSGLFYAVSLVLKTAPLAALGAVAFAVGHYGLVSMTPLLKLVGAIYASTALYLIVVLGALARCCGISLWRLVLWIGDELVLVLGTASSLAAMPRLIVRLELAGCASAVTRVAVPASYSFNLVGSAIYLTLALGFLAQAGHVELGLPQYALILAVAMVTSKASSGIAGSAFVTLGATLALLPAIPADGLVLLVAIERLLKCRPLANLLGNGIGCLAVARSMRLLDPARLHASIGRS